MGQTTTKQEKVDPSPNTVELKFTWEIESGRGEIKWWWKDRPPLPSKFAGKVDPSEWDAILSCISSFSDDKEEVVQTKVEERSLTVNDDSYQSIQLGDLPPAESTATSDIQLFTRHRLLGRICLIIWALVLPFLLFWLLFGKNYANDDTYEIVFIVLFCVFIVSFYIHGRTFGGCCFCLFTTVGIMCTLCNDNGGQLDTAADISAAEYLKKAQKHGLAAMKDAVSKLRLQTAVAKITTVTTTASGEEKYEVEVSCTGEVSYPVFKLVVTATGLPQQNGQPMMIQQPPMNVN